MTLLYVFIAFALLFVGARLFVRAPEDPPEDASDDDIRRLALEGRKIDAIRWHRLLHGTDLKDAKAAVEALAAAGAPRS
jgi:ribosomal protein L7/L12